MNNTKSKKGFTLVEIMIVVVIIGLLAAMAIPAFNKVREQSREKSITNNLRQIASAGQQYILEEGETQVTFTALEGTYFPTIAQVSGENYNALIVGEDGGSLVVTTSGGDTIIYTY
ncbi:type II secretion system protein [Rubellicoccus peritrichatus]|uniref:Prepilin-type N-terminal cleavage/methylation domain-containing protein n=1 Tax=Rubellicoccus peritrichatus TaxID=3080537 RepID=A0AAQ3LIV7_9BACT|nr:prepilin-type N-terminal cleavage/methylation domain-containing protein [Puniceicoccus sp. CR14]WOO42949.1 prepilin-type N-terminal cleavage/methylation domain-containing protein [Puniceicoccus sp. CR14]